VRIHLVDGTYELFRAYYGPPGRRAPDGREIGATLALARSLVGLVRDEGATHVGVAFDHVVESFRNELFDGYKTGVGLDPELTAQFPLAERAAAALGCTVWPMVEFEADDALATAAARFSGDERVERVLICTPDKDLAQCVRGERVVGVDRRRGNVIDEAAVVEKFGVSPTSIPDWLALVGDSADGIPGIPRWGARSTSTVLGHYRFIERIPDDVSRWGVRVRGAAGLAENLSKRRPEAALYKKLATLRTDVPLEEGLDDLEWKGARRAEVDDLGRAMGDESLASRVPRWR